MGVKFFRKSCTIEDWLWGERVAVPFDLSCCRHCHGQVLVFGCTTVDDWMVGVGGCVAGEVGGWRVQTQVELVFSTDCQRDECLRQSD